MRLEPSARSHRLDPHRPHAASRCCFLSPAGELRFDEFREKLHQQLPKTETKTETEEAPTAEAVFEAA
jgi:hypothetical protein